jgi:hypothetical protein
MASGHYWIELRMISMQDKRHSANKKSLGKKPSKPSREPSAAQLQHKERRFVMGVITTMMAAGLLFMALHVPGGERIALSAGSLLTGQSVISKLKGSK